MNKKKIMGIILLFIMLIILKLFLGGTYLYNFWEELIPQIIILLMVSAVLMIVPFIARLINKKVLEYKKGRIICFINSLVLFLIFSIPNYINIINNRMSKTIHPDATTIDPIQLSKQLILIYFITAIIYYFINMCFFVENKKKNK